MLDRFIINIQTLSWQSKIFAIVLAFLAPLASVIHVIIALLLVDAVTSIYYQMKQQDGTMIQKLRIIESRRLRKTIEKMFFYVVMIIVFYSFDLYILKIEPVTPESIHTLSLSNLAAVLISLVELTSIASNVSKITGNPIFDRILKIFSKKANKQLDIDNENNT